MTGSDELGAFCDHDAVRAGPLGGGPLSDREFAAKDVFDVEGHICCAGNPDWLASHDPAAVTAPAVRLLLEAGGTLVGKTRCDELTYSIAGRNAHYGTPVNSRAPGRLPGGSSSGSAAAVAGGLVGMALGTDTTGSIRTPAALCGLWGLRPTLGGVQTSGAMPLAPSFDTVGALAAGPELLRATNEILLDPAPIAPLWSRVAMPEDAWSLADPDVRNALESEVATLPQEFPAERVAFDERGLEHWSEAVRIVQSHEIWAVHGPWVERVKPEFGPGVGQRMRAAREVTDEQSAQSRRLLERFGRRVRELVGDDTVVALPTCPTVPPRAETPEEELSDWRSRVMQLTAPANVSGLPQLVVPGGEVGGLPVSISLIGPEHSELALIDLAVSLGL